MNVRRFLLPLLLAVTLGAGPARALAADTDAAETGPIAEFREVFNKVNARVASGHRTEAECSAELAELDAVVTKYSNDKSDDIARYSVTRARLYLEDFADVDKCIELLKQVKVDYPKTKVAAEIDGFIAQLSIQADAVHAIKAQAQAKVTQAAKLVVGEEFPAIKEKNILGKTVTLENYRGKIVLVEFWGTWSYQCFSEVSDLQTLYEKYHARGFDILGIAIDDDKIALRRFVENHEISWTQICDGKKWQSKLLNRFGVTKAPTGYLLDRNGKILVKDVAVADLEAKLAELLP